jgi:hypothetical protein
VIGPGSSPGRVRELAETGEIRSTWIKKELYVAVEDIDAILEPMPHPIPKA